jgi:hypothetical protein
MEIVFEPGLEGLSEFRFVFDQQNPHWIHFSTLLCDREVGAARQRAGSACEIIGAEVLKSPPQPHFHPSR